MAVATDSQKLRSALKVTQYDFDPGATTATEIAWVDFRDYDAALFSFFRTIGTGALTMSVLANTASDGSGTDVTVKTTTVSAEPDAVGDYIFEEVTAEEIRQASSDAGVDARYVTLVCAVGTGTDEGVVTYILRGKRAYKDQTANSVA